MKLLTVISEYKASSNITHSQRESSWIPTFSGKMDHPKENASFYIDIKPQALPIEKDNVLLVNNGTDHNKSYPKKDCILTNFDPKSNTKLSQLDHMSSMDLGKPPKTQHEAVDSIVKEEFDDNCSVKLECTDETTDLLSFKENEVQLKIPMFGCVICSQVCSSKTELLAHCKERHFAVKKEEQTNQIQQKSKKSRGRQKVACKDLCQCLYCGARFRLQSDLERHHVKMKHFNSTQPTNALETPESMKPTNTATIWMSHKSHDVQGVASERPYELTKQTPQESPGKHDRREASCEGPYKCVYCGVEALCKKELQRHVEHCNSAQAESVIKEPSYHHVFIQPTTTAIQISQNESQTNEKIIDGQGQFRSLRKIAVKRPFRNHQSIVKNKQSGNLETIVNQSHSHDDQETARIAQRPNHQGSVRKRQLQDIQEHGKLQAPDLQSTVRKRQCPDIQNNIREDLIPDAVLRKAQSQKLCMTATGGQSLDLQSTVTKSFFKDLASATRKQFPGSNPTTTEGKSQVIYLLKMAPNVESTYLQSPESNGQAQDVNAAATNKLFQAYVIKGQSTIPEATATEDPSQNVCAPTMKDQCFNLRTTPTKGHISDLADTRKRFLDLQADATEGQSQTLHATTTNVQSLDLQTTESKGTILPQIIRDTATERLSLKVNATEMKKGQSKTLQPTATEGPSPKVHATATQEQSKNLLAMDTEGLTLKVQATVTKGQSTNRPVTSTEGLSPKDQCFNLRTTATKGHISDLADTRKRFLDNQADATEGQSQNLHATTTKVQSLDLQTTVSKGTIRPQILPDTATERLSLKVNATEMRKGQSKTLQPNATEGPSPKVHATATQGQSKNLLAMDTDGLTLKVHATVTKGQSTNHPVTSTEVLSPKVENTVKEGQSKNLQETASEDLTTVTKEQFLESTFDMKTRSAATEVQSQDHQEIPSKEPFKCGITVKHKKASDSHIELKHWRRNDVSLAEAETLFRALSRVLQSTYCTSEYELALLWKQNFPIRSPDLHIDKCPLCLKPVKLMTNIIFHLRTHKDEIILAQQDRAYICSICSMTMETPDALAEHVLKNHEKQTFQLINSGNAAIDVSLKELCLQSQEELVHKWQKVLEIVQMSYFCDQCGMHFPCLDDLKQHTMNGMIEECIHKSSFQCDICQIACSNYKELNSHHGKHLSLQNVFCPICKKYLSKGYYEYLPHMNSLHDKRVFRCHMCESSFKVKRTYLKHLETEHKVGYWKSCHRCGKDCTRTNFMKHYNRSHRTFVKKEPASVVDDGDTKEKLCAKCKCPMPDKAHVCTITEDFENHKWFCCTRCDDVKYFIKLQGLLEHNRSQHNIEHLETSVNALDIPLDTDEYRMCKILQTQCKASDVFKNTNVQFRNDEIRCPLCTAVIHITNLYIHITSHRCEVSLCAQNRSYMCSWCFSSFGDATDLVKHARKCHPDHMAKLGKGAHAFSLHTLQRTFIKQWLRVLGVIKDGYPCSSCRNHFPTAQAIGYHKLVGCKSVKGNVRCSHCDLECSYIEYLRHFVEKHIDGETEQDCPVCDKSISTVKFIEHLQEQHMQVLKTVCVLCGERFKSTNSMTMHKVKVHKAAIEYICEICGYKTISKVTLDGHMNKHTGGSYKCSFCDATFQYKASKCRHERSHKEKPKFTCPKCPSTFVQRASLNRHVKTNHENVRYACDICGKTFSQTHPIMQHRKKCHPGAWKRSVEELLVKND